MLNASGTIYGRINLFWRQYGTSTDHVDPSRWLLFAPSLTIELGKHTTLTLPGQYYYDWCSTAFRCVGHHDQTDQEGDSANTFRLPS